MNDAVVDDSVNTTTSNEARHGPRRTSKFSFNLQPGDTGYPLLCLILDKIQTQKLKTSEACSQMGFSENYFIKLRKKESYTDQMPNEYYEGIARFLNTSAIAVMVLGERIKPEDFHRKDTDIPMYLDRAINFMMEDPDWQVFIPPNLQEAEYNIKFLVVKLYEQLTQTQLIGGSIDYESLLNEVEKLN